MREGVKLKLALRTYSNESLHALQLVLVGLAVQLGLDFPQLGGIGFKVAGIVQTDLVHFFAINGVTHSHSLQINKQGHSGFSIVLGLRACL